MKLFVKISSYSPRFLYIAFPQSFHQVASLLRRDPLSVQGPSKVPPSTETYDLTNEKVRKRLHKP